MTRLSALTAMLLSFGSAQAAITVYTSQANFLAAISAPGTDTFNDLVPGDLVFGPIGRTAGSYGYTANTTTSAANSSFFVAGSPADPWLSTNVANDSILVFSFTGGVRGAGAFFFGTDVDGFFLPGDVTVSASDADGSVSETIVNATPGSFLGFVSTLGLDGLSLAAVQPTSGAFLWPTINDLTLGAQVGDPTVIPLPGAFSLMAPVLLLAGLSASRRRKQ